MALFSEMMDEVCQLQNEISSLRARLEAEQLLCHNLRERMKGAAAVITPNNVRLGHTWLRRQVWKALYGAN